jgi:hypothetical protein
MCRKKKVDFFENIGTNTFFFFFRFGCLNILKFLCEKGSRIFEGEIFSGKKRQQDISSNIFFSTVSQKQNKKITHKKNKKQGGE